MPSVREDESNTDTDKASVPGTLADSLPAVSQPPAAVQFYASDGLAKERQQPLTAASAPASPVTAANLYVAPAGQLREDESKKQIAASSPMEVGSGAELQQTGVLSPRTRSAAASEASAGLDSRNRARTNAPAASAAPKGETNEGVFRNFDEASGRAGEQRSLALALGNSATREEAAGGLNQNMGLASAPPAVAARAAQDGPATQQRLSRSVESAARKSKDLQSTTSLNLEKQKMIATQLRLALTLQQDGRTTESAELLTLMLRQVQDEEVNAVATTRNADEATTPQ